MADETGRRERDVVLAPNEFMFFSDQSKGDVNVYVGPTKQTLSDNDRPMLFDDRTKRFVESDASRAKQLTKTAPEGWYVVLKNPAPEGKGQPNAGSNKPTVPALDVGKKVNIPGPVSMFLWPGQMAKVLKGHHLRSNQYLIVRVYDEDAAKKNWKDAVVKSAGTGTDTAIPGSAKLTMGQVLVIKGIDVSFYIPPTGVEVMADSEGDLVRDAVTLERLEYCLLMDENGRKRYEQGPKVVFPEPTEVFVEHGGSRKARAIELNENSGLYIKVIAEYQEGAPNGPATKYNVGDELFITGKDQMIYFPREEHAVIKYDQSDKHYGIAIPAGEGRYVLDRNSGDVRIVSGPKVFLPDPRQEVIVRRVLDDSSCSVLYPNNGAVLDENRRRSAKSTSELFSGSLGMLHGASGAMMGPVGPHGLMGPALDASAAFGGEVMYSSNSSISSNAESRGLSEKPSKAFAGDAFQRGSQYTPPRTVTLSSKFDGAVSVDVWTGYAMMLVRKSGERRVVLGPKSVMLQYDELPQVLQLSTGKPKSTDALVKTAFLRVTANWVTDIIQVETKDFCKLDAKVSYRLNFEGSPEKWFSVENYVKHLCDHMRSKLRAAVQKLGVEQFYGDHATVIRDVVLGKTDGTAPRSGASFEENGMRVYDVEVLGIEMKDTQISTMMTNAQRESVSSSLQLVAQQRRLDVTKESERLKQEEAECQAQTRTKKLELDGIELSKRVAFELQGIEAEATRAEQTAENQKAAETARALLADIARHRQTKDAQAETAIEVEKQAVRLAAVRAEVEALVARAGAISPDLVAALSAFGERAMVEKVATAMAPMSIMGGGSVVEILGKLLHGTNLAKQLASIAPNGSGHSLPAAE